MNVVLVYRFDRMATGFDRMFGRPLQSISRRMGLSNISKVSIKLDLSLFTWGRGGGGLVLTEFQEAAKRSKTRTNRFTRSKV